MKENNPNNQAHTKIKQLKTCILIKKSKTISKFRISEKI